MSLAVWNQVYVVTEDKTGRRSCNFVTTAIQTGFVSAALTDFATAYQAITGAKVIAVQQLLTNHLGGALTAGAYDTAFDRATLLTKFGDAKTGHIDVVAPKDSVFRADGQTVDLSDPGVSAFVTAALAVAGQPSGALLTQIVRGTRTRVHPNTGG